MEKMIANLFEVANRNHDEMQGLPRAEIEKKMRHIFDNSDVVWGCWHHVEHGFGMFPLKGDAIFQEATRHAATSPDGFTKLRMSAIVCTYETARDAEIEARGSYLGR